MRSAQRPTKHLDNGPRENTHETCWCMRKYALTGKSTPSSTNSASEYDRAGRIADKPEAIRIDRSIHIKGTLFASVRYLLSPRCPSSTSAHPGLGTQGHSDSSRWIKRIRGGCLGHRHHYKHATVRVHHKRVTIMTPGK